jgi:inorganic pyrophosphatase/exopolyphosphatase
VLAFLRIETGNSHKTLFLGASELQQKQKHGEAEMMAYRNKKTPHSVYDTIVVGLTLIAATKSIIIIVLP